MILLRFVKYSDVSSTLIATWQKDGWATHVEAVMPDGSGWIGAQTTTSKPKYIAAGVYNRPINYDSGTKIIREQYITITDATPEQSDDFYKFMVSQIGKPYDYLALAGLILGRDWRSEKSWFCSELIAFALEVAKYWKLTSDSNHIDPRDLYLILSGRLNIKDHCF